MKALYPSFEISSMFAILPFKEFSFKMKHYFWLTLCKTLSVCSVQSLSHVWLFATPWTAACQASMSVTNSQSLLKLMPIVSVMTSNDFILCHPLLLLPSIFPASESFPVSQFFSSGSQSIAALTSASVLPMNIQDWFPLGLTGLISLKSKGLWRVFPTPQFKNINSSVLSFLYGPTLFNPNMTTGKSIALTRWPFVGRAMSLLFNMLFRFVIAFLPRSKSLLISWLQSPSTVILEPKKIKSVTVSIVSPSI